MRSGPNPSYRTSVDAAGCEWVASVENLRSLGGGNDHGYQTIAIHQTTSDIKVNYIKEDVSWGFRPSASAP